MAGYVAKEETGMQRPEAKGRTGRVGWVTRHGYWRRLGAFLAVGAMVLTLPGAAVARTKGSVPSQAPVKTAGPASVAWITVHAESGEVLASQDPDRPGAPASMTKMMLALLVAEAGRDGQLKLTDPVTASALASKMGGSQVYLKQGETFSVEEMMAAMLIGSANDASAALAEKLAGTLPGAIVRMNDRAKQLGMSQTRFGSVHGLPPSPGQEGDITTPRDMARLAMELVKFPEVLKWTATKEAPFRGGVFSLQNSNLLVGTVSGVDGLKTGHYREAGYNVSATAKRGGLRVITVVMGAVSNKERFAEAARLLEEAFAQYVEVTLAKANTPLAPEVRLPRASGPFKPVVGQDVRLLVKRTDRDGLKTAVEITPGLRAPVKRGEPVGHLVARVGNRELTRVPVVAPADIARALFWWLTPWK
jgi:D-alanyl-D-alanine carboxypeptidase (penicillin-binding protein 5/6)